MLQIMTLQRAYMVHCEEKPADCEQSKQESLKVGETVSMSLKLSICVYFSSFNNISIQVRTLNSVVKRLSPTSEIDAALNRQLPSVRDSKGTPET